MDVLFDCFICQPFARISFSEALSSPLPQKSIPLVTVFNLSLEEGIVPLEWKEANIIPLFKKG